MQQAKNLKPARENIEQRDSQSKLASFLHEVACSYEDSIFKVRRLKKTKTQTWMDERREK
jgi:hypothetical protein